MENLSNFPLLRLPTLAIEEVLSTWTPFEIISFSSIPYSNCKHLVDILFDTRKYQTGVWILENLSFHIMGTSVTYRYRVTPNIEEHGVYKFIKVPGDQIEEMSVYSGAITPLEKWKEIGAAATNCFKVGLSIIVFDFDTFSETNKEMTDWLTLMKASQISALSVRGKNEQYADVSYFLEKIESTIHLFFSVELKKPMKLPKVSKELSIHNAGWVTVEELGKLDAPKIGLWNTKLTNKDLNTFLKRWIRMECQREMKKLFVTRENPESLVEILEGIDREEIDTERKWKPESYVRVIHDIAEIRRSDGTMATVRVVQKGMLFFDIFVHMS